MSARGLYRLSGLALVVGAVVLLVAVVVGGALFPDPVAPGAVQHPLYLPVALLSTLGAAVLIAGLPGIYVRRTEAWGGVGSVGLALIYVTLLLFGVFFGLLQALVLPFIVAQVPQMPEGAGPDGLFLMFILGTLAQAVGSVLLALPILRGRVAPRWAGYCLVAGAVVAVIGFFLSGPSGPPGVPAIIANTLSGVLLLVPLGWFGYGLWSEADREVVAIAG